MTDLQPQLLAVTLEGWPGLGAGPVRFELGWERTVLVGKNGAGKSVVLEAFVDAARTALQRSAKPRDETVSFKCEIGTPGHVQLTYEYAISNAATDDDGDELSSPGVTRTVWTEQCARGSGEVLWSLRDGKLKLNATEVTFPQGVGLIAMSTSFESIIPEVALIRSRLGAVELVRAGVPRSTVGVRRLLTLLKRDSDESAWQPLNQRTDRVDRLALRIANLARSAEADFAELNDVVKRLGIGSRLAVLDLKAKEETLGWVMLDDVNLGLLSDGTLRVLEILTLASSRSRSVVCVEEPETGIHPGLLDRLLAVLKRYSRDRQIVVSTHSPYVVSWCDAADLRLVERISDGTSIRGFRLEELERIAAYLRDEGTIDSYIFEHTDEEG